MNFLGWGVPTVADKIYRGFLMKNGTPVPIGSDNASEFIDAPIDGNLYGRKDGDWSEIGPSVSEYIQGEDYRAGFFVYLNEHLYRIVQDFTADDTEATTEESLELDIQSGNLVRAVDSNVSFKVEHLEYVDTNIFTLEHRPVYTTKVHIINDESRTISYDYCVAGKELSIEDELNDGDIIEIEYLYDIINFVPPEKKRITISAGPAAAVNLLASHFAYDVIDINFTFSAQHPMINFPLTGLTTDDLGRIITLTLRPTANCTWIWGTWNGTILGATVPLNTIEASKGMTIQFLVVMSGSAVKLRIMGHRFRHIYASPMPTATITPDAELTRSWICISQTANTTIAAPVSTFIPGHVFSLGLRNSSAASINLTWNGVYVAGAGKTLPATLAAGAYYGCSFMQVSDTVWLLV